MHVVNIPRWAIERVIERYGTAHPYADLDLARTALVVVDMQNGFMVEGVVHALCKAAVEIVPNVNRLATAVRRTGAGWSGSRIRTIPLGSPCTPRCARRR